MISRLSKTIAENLVNATTSKKYSTVAVSFGLEIIFTALSGIACLIIISILCHKPFAWFFFTLGFAPLRTTAGGYHANSRLSCFLMSAGLFILSLVVSFLITWDTIIYLVISMFSLFFIIIWSPVEAVNKRLNKDKILNNRKKSVISSIFNTLLACTLTILNVHSVFINLYFTGIAMAAFLLIIAKIKSCGRMYDRESNAQ